MSVCTTSGYFSRKKCQIGGAALAEKYKGTGKVVLLFFGSGYTNCGAAGADRYPLSRKNC